MIRQPRPLPPPLTADEIARQVRELEMALKRMIGRHWQEKPMPPVKSLGA